MAYNKKTAAYVRGYKANKIKRVPLDMQVSDYEELKAAAAKANETVNGYIKLAIQQRIERDNNAAQVHD